MNKQVERNSEHGQTVAAWVLTVTVIIGSALIALGIFLSTTSLWVAGLAIATIGALTSFVLHQMGYGQKPK